MSSNMGERWYKFCIIVLKEFYLNVLWVASTLMGGIIFGIGPATIALLAVQKEIILGNDDVAVFHLFKNTYKSHFKKASITGLIYIFVGIVLVTNIYATQNYIARVFFLLVGFFYLISLTFIAPVALEFNLPSLKEQISASVIIGFSYLHYTLALFLIITLIIAGLLLHLGLLSFFGIPLVSYITMKFANSVITRARYQSENHEVEIK